MHLVVFGGGGGNSEVYELYHLRIRLGQDGAASRLEGPKEKRKRICCACIHILQAV